MNKAIQLRALEIRTFIFDKTAKEATGWNFSKNVIYIIVIGFIGGLAIATLWIYSRKKNVSFKEFE